jgi:hypothetical protein
VIIKNIKYLRIPVFLTIITCVKPFRIEKLKAILDTFKKACERKA